MKEPKVTECKICGEEVELWNAWANECVACNTEYNGFGQQLAPREQWEWELEEDY